MRTTILTPIVSPLLPFNTVFSSITAADYTFSIARDHLCNLFYRASGGETFLPRTARVYKRNGTAAVPPIYQSTGMRFDHPMET